MPYLQTLEEQGIIRIQVAESDSSSSPDAASVLHSIKIRHKTENLQALYDKVPSNLKWKMKDSAIALNVADLQSDLSKHLAGIVDVTSMYMILNGIYSTNPLKGIPYLYDKFKKGKT